MDLSYGVFGENLTIDGLRRLWFRSVIVSAWDGRAAGDAAANAVLQAGDQVWARGYGEAVLEERAVGDLFFRD